MYMQPEKTALAQLINKYLEGNCTPEETETLFSWIEQLDLVKAPVIDELTGLRLKQRIDKVNLATNRQPQLHAWRPFLYAAASIVFAVVLISLYFTGRYTIAAKPSAPVAVLTRKQTVTFYHITNLGTKPHLLTLEDGSSVLLESKSTLFRQVPFGPQHRKVELQGKAFFRIARNKKKPFDVYSGNITTTALGTSFWVDQNIRSGSIQVKLITGKVVIRDHRPERQKLLGYLIPGQQLSYNINKGTAFVSNSLSKQVKKVDVKRYDTPATLIFSHTPMDSVLDQIQDYYKIKIKYNPDDVRSMAFYGTYNLQDDVELILKTITVSNGLTLTKSGDSFQISK